MSGRRSEYSDEEDRILMETAGASPEATNQRLVAAGFEPRSASSLKNRRYYLSKNPPSQGGRVDIDRVMNLVVGRLPGGGEDRLAALAIRRRIVETQVEEVQAELDALLAERDRLSREIHAVVADEGDGPKQGRRG